MNDIITNIEKYKTGWIGGLPETQCGHGSKIQETKKQREWIPKIIEQYGIKTISDIGAGDLNWIKKIKFNSYIDYKAYDLVPRHESVNEFNLLTTVPPKSDLIMCLWVLNHFPDTEHHIGFQNLINSESKYLLITQRESWVKYHLHNIVDSIKLNYKNDYLILAKL